MEDERRLTAQGAERKQQLLDCAAQLFAERGYADTRVIDIVRAAGVAKGLFYWYFENKEQLFRELAQDIRLRLRRSQGEAIDPNADALTRIRQGSEASVRFMAINAPFFSLLEVENLDRRFVDVLRTGTEVHVTDVAALIREGITAGLIRDDDPLLLARGVVGIVGLYSHFHRTGRSDVPIDELAQFVGRWVVRSLAADDEIARSVEPDGSRTRAAQTAIGPSGRG
ncbi:MAG TPA: TetR family transcriptional regulator [Jatrophihabitantaceae bacterium]|nr:TetR family transcriptional regulator [Jatrophihabitantaceae bacterium]